VSALLLVLGALSASATSAGAVTSRGESAKQLVQAAAKALASARSLRMSGTMATSGGSTAVDFELFSNGDVDGSITSGGQLVHVTVVDGTDYLQASAAYWQKEGSLPATLAKSIAPEWISFPNSGSNGFGTSFEIGSLAASLKATTGWSIVGHKKVDGHAAVGVKGSDGEVLWIAASGTPYPILDSKKGSGGGTVTFGGWNSFKLPKAPKKAIALSSLRS